MPPSMEAKQENQTRVALGTDRKGASPLSRSDLGEADSQGGHTPLRQAQPISIGPPQGSLRPEMVVHGGMGGGMGLGMNHVMGGQGLPVDAPGGKKAVHVKWAGKTIALGTFPQAEADDKCARAKALTRAWRSTMRPKPEREWVMKELERLGVRVVSGRLGRKEGGGEASSDEDETGKKGDKGDMDPSKSQKLNGKKPESSKRPIERPHEPPEEARRVSLSSALPGAGMVVRSNSLDLRRDSLAFRRGSIGTPSLLSSAETMGRKSSLDLSGGFPQRRNSSLAMGLLHGEDEGLQLHRHSLTGSGSRRASLNWMGGSAGVKASDGRGSPDIPPHRPFVGGGSAAAYEAARADHYEQQKERSGESRRGSMPSKKHSLDLSALGGLESSSSARNLLGSSSGVPQLGLSSNANQHYEMLKLHHMNLLNEIQETTLMMTLYQQQMQQSQGSSDQQSVEQQLQQLAAQQQQVSSSLQLEQLYGGSGGSSQQLPSMSSQSSSLQQDRLGLGNGLSSSLGGSSQNQMQSLLLERQRMQNQDLPGMLPNSGGTEQRRLSMTGGQDLMGRGGERGEDPRRQIEEQEALLRKMKEEYTCRKRSVESDADWRKEKRPRRGSDAR